MKTDTIAAIATALNNGGISIIRVSGDEAIEIVDKVFYSKSGKQLLKTFPTHTIHFGYIKDQEVVIDEVLVSIMRAPRSYTSEDVVEINCHGGILVTQKILEAVIRNGARIADPGEFTKRAFLNGRIDLSQAEAVMDVITAKSDLALESSVNQLKGSVHVKIEEIRAMIIRDIAFIEAVLDDPEHYEFGDYQDELRRRLSEISTDLNKLIESSENGKFVREGIQTAIVGKPNAGKSSLLNILVGQEKAIVTSEAGTTRDIIEQAIQLDGVCLNIIDTAGIRDTSNIVEQIGVDKAKACMEQADLVLYVIDSSMKLDENDLEILEKIKDKKAIILLNKSDLGSIVTKKEINLIVEKPVISISAKDQTGIDQLKEYIKDMFFEGNINFNDQVYITNIRHKDALIESLKSLEQVMQSMDAQMPEDFLTIDLMSAYEKLGEIIGETTGEDLINTIFAEFCMGK